MVLQNNEERHSDIVEQQLTSDEGGAVEVVEAEPYIAPKVSDTADDVNLPSTVYDTEPQAPCDVNEVIRSGVESDSHKATSEEQTASEPVCDKTITTEDDDDDDVSPHRLDETVTGSVDDKLDFEDTAVVGKDVIVDSGIINSGLSETTDHAVDRIFTGDSVEPVHDDHAQLAIVTDHLDSSDVRLSQQVDDASEVVSEYKELPDGSDTSADLRDMSTLPDDVERVIGEVENTAAHTEGVVSPLVAEDVPVPQSCTEVQSDDTVTVGDADIVSDDAVDESNKVCPQPDQPHRTPDLVEDVPLPPSCTEVQSDDTVTVDDADIVSGNAVDESDKVYPQPHQTPDLALEEASQPSDGLRESRLQDEIGSGDAVCVDKDVGSVDAGTTAQFEHVENDDDVEPLLGEDKDARVVSSTSDGASLAKCDSRQSADAEPVMLPQNIDADIPQPTCDDAVSDGGVVSPTVVESGRPQPGTDADVVPLLDHMEDGVAQSASDEAVSTSEVSLTGDAIAAVGSDNWPSVCDVKFVNDVKDAVEDSVAAQEPTVDETCDGEDWLDNVVNVSDVSFVNKDDISEAVSADVSQEHKTDESTAVDTSNDDVSGATAVEGHHATVDDTGTSEEHNDVDKASSGEDSVAKCASPVAVCIDTAVCEPVDKEANLQQPETDADGRTEKSRLYSKNVKPEILVTGPAASLAAEVKDTGKAGTPPQQDAKVTGDEPSENQTVVMRKKSPAEPDKAVGKEQETCRIQKVRTAFYLTCY